MSTSAKLLKREFNIEEITSIHFFEYKSDFIFKTEIHDCWKLLYVEEGSAEIIADRSSAQAMILEKGDIYIQAPNECYSFRAVSGQIPVLFSIGFYCDSPHMEALRNRKFPCMDNEKKLLFQLSAESRKAFSPKVSGNSEMTLESNYSQPFGSEQMVSLYLEMLFISLIREYVSRAEDMPDSDITLKTDTVLFNRIKDYYASNVTAHVNIHQICKEYDIGRSHLQRIFREQTGYSAIEYFCQMRISAAKKMIRENNCSLKETATALGYTSIPYFSRQFKQISGMTPSEYQKSIKDSKNNPVYQHVDYHGEAHF